MPALRQSRGPMGQVSVERERCRKTTSMQKRLLLLASVLLGTTTGEHSFFKAHQKGDSSVDTYRRYLQTDAGSGDAAANATDAAAAAAGAAPPSATEGIIAIVQSGFFCVMGPVILFYGPVVIRVVIFIQSLFASEFALFVNTFATVAVPTIWDSFSNLVFLVAGTITLAFAAIRGEKIRGVMNGAVLGILVSKPLMEFASTLLFVNWAKCTMDGEKTKDFPAGSPAGCDPDSVPYMVSFHLTKGLAWLIIFIFAKLGQTKIWVSFSAAMVGATMFLDGFLDVLTLILGLVDPELIPDIVTAISSIRTFLGYGLAGLGAAIQFFITKTDKDPKTGKKVTKLHEAGKAKMFNIFLKPPLSHMLKCITVLDNIIMKAMEGKTKLVPMNSLSPGQMMDAMGGMALPMAIKAAKPILNPILEKVGLAFADIEMIFNKEITELEHAKDAAADPMGFFNGIWANAEYKATLLPSIVNNFGPKLNPMLEKSLISWDDVKDPFNEILVTVETFGDLVSKLAKPEFILEHPKVKAKIDEAKAAAAKAAEAEAEIDTENA